MVIYTIFIVRLFRLPSLITWLITLYSFSDLLYRVLVGPLLPLFCLTLLQIIVYHLLVTYDDTHTSWFVKGVYRRWNVRELVLYVLYPLVLCGVTSVVSCMYNINNNSEAVVGGGDEQNSSGLCLFCIYNTVERGGVLIRSVFSR